MICALLHNFIRSHIALDPMKHLLEDLLEDLKENNTGVTKSNNEWTKFRNNLANTRHNCRHDIPNLKENCSISIDNVH